jgi:hypothetical protein
VTDRANGGYYNMRDYHVFSLDSIGAKATDHGIALELSKIPWAQKQLWAPDCVFMNGSYFLFFPAKDTGGFFRIGVASSTNPAGPFTAEPQPISYSYSIDPAVFQDSDKTTYLLFGGLQGGQLQRYRNNQLLSCDSFPAVNEPALCPKIAKLKDSLPALAEAPKDLILLDSAGHPLLAGDHPRRFFEAAWMHRFHGKYYFSYSTGDMHLLCYATGDSPYGPFTYRGVLLTPVVGWTTHHSIVEFHGRWYLFYHDSKPSGGISSLRSLKVRELLYNEDGTIKTMNGQE